MIPASRGGTDSRVLLRHSPVMPRKGTELPGFGRVISRPAPNETTPVLPAQTPVVPGEDRPAAQLSSLAALAATPLAAYILKLGCHDRKCISVLRRTYLVLLDDRVALECDDATKPRPNRASAG